MSADRYKVIVVVDGDFGERLNDIPAGTPVWIVDTPKNKLAAEHLRHRRPDDTHLTGITTFHARGSAEQVVLAEIDTIDLHHGEYSSQQPYSLLEVVGTPLTNKIKARLMQYGFVEFRGTASGFEAIRPIC